jgi:hypothetical protein
MIKYNLKCHNDHEFESWFSNSNEFDNLKKKKLLECIFCSSKKINKSIMSPMVSSIKDNNEDIKDLSKKLQNEKNRLLKLRVFVQNNFKYVGKNFSRKVREIYYDKKSQKSIYGSVTSKERRELEEEGIALLSIPWVNKDN